MFADRLKHLRESKGFTQEYMASALKISRPTYTRYETGKREPDYQMLVQIAVFFGVSTDYLLNITDKLPQEVPSPVPDEMSIAIAKLSPEKRKQAKNFIDFLNSQED